MTDYSKIADQLYPADQPQPIAPPSPEPRAEEQVEPQPAPRSKYSAAADLVFGEQDARLRTSVFGAGMANPDAAARARKIAERTGMAPDAIERNMPTAERQVLVEDVDTHTRDTPALRAAYGDPYFAKAAKDDLFSLTEVEKAVRRVFDPTADDRKRSREMAGEVGKFMAESAKQIGMGLTVGLGAGVADVAGMGSDILSGLTGSTWLESKAVEYRRIAERANEAMDYFSNKAEGNLAAGLQSGFRSAGTNLALLPAGIAGGTNALLLPMVSMVGAASFNKARGKGQDRIDSALFAAPDAVFEYAFEKVPASRLLGDIAKNSSLWTMVNRQLLPEILGEQATTVLQDLNEWVRLNPSKTAAEFIAERPDAAIQTLVATLVGVGVQTGTVRGIQRVLGGASEQEARARDAEVRANNLGELFEIAAGSKLRGRDATTFGAFVQQAAEANGSPLADVQVDAAKLDEVLNQTRTSREAFAAMSPKAAEALEDALASGGAVSIPVGDLVGRMGDSGIETALLPHLRIGEDGLSQEEAVAEQAAAQQLLQAESERIVAQAQESQVLEESVEKVRTTMFAQLQAAGRFSADVNRAYSTLVGSFYTVLGSRLGVTPEQAYAQFPLRVQGVTPEGETLGQPRDSSAAAIGDQLQERINADFESAVQEYASIPDTNGGQIINTDLARELSPEYREDRTRSADVHEASSAFAKRLYADKLSRPTPEGKLPTVLFTGGGTGAGKSTGLNLLASSSDAEIIYDTNMNGEQSSVTKIEQALAAGRTVHILYVYRDPVEALVAGALPRAMRMGRTVPIQAHAETHAGARATVEKIAARYAGDQRVVISVVDNSRGRGKAALTSLDKLPQVVESGLKEKLYEATQAEYAAGRISEAVARGTTGEQPVARREGGEGVRGESEQADSAPPAQLSDFTPEGLPGLLAKDGWAILTAADPGATKQSEEQNAAANALLRQDLDDIGLEYTEAVGKYGDTQSSFIVVGIPERVAQALGNKYGQESILTRKGLIYQDGSITPATGVEVFDTAPEDFYTEVPGTGAFFSVALDFDTRVQPEGVYNQSLSARVPTAAGSTNDVNVVATSDLAALQLAPKLLEKIAARLDAVASLRTRRLKDLDARLDAYIDQMVDNLVWLHDQVPAEIRERSKKWYDGARALVDRVVARYGGQYTAPQIAGVYAVMSPQMDWFQNVTLGDRIIDIWSAQQDSPWTPEMDAAIRATAAAGSPEILDAIAGKALGQLETDAQRAYWIAAYDLAYNTRDFHVVTPEGDFADLSRNNDGRPMRVSWANGFVPIAKAVSVLRDGSIENISDALGKKHKVRNFYNNIFDPNSALGFVTSDTHAVSAALLLPLSGESPEVKDNFGSAGQHAATGIFGSYPVYVEVYKRAAQRVSERDGATVLPREMQSITWEALRGLFTPSFKGKYNSKKDSAFRTEFDNIWKDYHAGRTDVNTARERVLALAGGITPPDWYGPDTARTGQRWSASYAGQLLAPGGAAGTTDGGTGSDAAGRAGVPGSAQAVDDTATQVEQRRMRQAVDLAMLQGKAAEADALNQTAPGAKPGEVAITGVHFSTRPGLNYLNGQFYGTGLKGAEKDRVRNSADTRLASRTYFYVDEGKGVRPEAGVGGNAHEAQLTNLYDINTDPLGLIVGGDINATETNVLNAGFDGYYRRDAFNQQGAAVVLGPASHAIQVTPIANPTTKAPPVQTAPPVYKRGLMSSEIKKLDIKAIQTVAPSARLQAGTFQVLAAERDAAASVAQLQGVDLPEAYAQGTGTRGTFNPKSLTISLLETADLSTFLHETGHFMLEVLADVSSRVDAPVAAREDMDAVLKWFGIDDLAKWNSMSLKDKTPYHEKFAEGFEAYLFEGKAPSRELQPLFQRFAAWFKNVYRSLADFMQANNTQLSDEVRAVFDRMLAAEDQIEQMEQQHLFGQMFTSKPDTMTDEEFAEYMLANQVATGEAIDELQARSLRDLRWLLNARSRELKKLSKDVAEKRKAVEDEVRAEVQAMPVYLVQRWLKTGVLADGTQSEGAKLNTDDLRDIFGDSPAAPWRYLATNMISNERALSLHPDVVADMFGYSSGEAMVRDIVAAFPFEQTVQGLTDTRVLERHGDIASQKAMEEAANAAVHNEYRARALATELKALTQATQPVRVLAAAAKSFALQLVGRKRIKDVKPGEFVAAEKRAAKRAAQASAEGSTQDAAVAKRDQVLQFHAAQAARDALEQVRKARELFNKIVTGKDDVIGKTRDMALVNATRAILANYGFGAKAKTAHDYLLLLRDHDPAMFDTVGDRVIAAEQAGKPFNELTIDELGALVDEVKSFWLLARRTRQIEVDGKLVDLETAQDALAARLDEIGIPARIPGEGSAVTPAEKRVGMLQSFVAAARRVEQWIGAKDGADTGPFRTYVFNAIKDAADNYRHDRNRYIKRYQQLLASIAPSMKRGIIEAPEIGYTFGKDSGGVAMGELLHAILHTGNESNKRKLLLGRKWAAELPDGSLDTTAWDSFVQRMIDEGRLTKAHYDFAQGVWDLLESTKPLAQKMHRDVFGRFFNEVSANSFVTPFGSYRGGYVPAMTDPRVVSDAKTRALAEEENQTMAFAFPTTNKGFTKSRVDYNKPLMLDLRTLSGHMDKVLLFSHMEGPVRDARRVLTGKGVAYALNRIDPAAFDSLLTPWLNRASKQLVETPVPGSAGMMRFFSGARANAGMAAMFANVSNTVQQITGLSIAAIRVPPRHLRSAMAAYAARPKQVANDIASISKFMEARMENEVSAIHNAIDEILLDPNVYQKAQAWTRKHAYFMQQAVDNIIGPVVWLGAHNDALERGLSEVDARRHADSVVRTTQGSTLPEDVARIETGNAFVRLFTQFMGYFNMQANTVGTEMVKVMDSVGLRKGAGRAMYVMMFGALAPAWVAEAIAQAFKGGPGDEDGDGWYLDDWLLAVFGIGTLRTATAAVPVAGQIVNAGANVLNNKPYDDRIGNSPAISMLESTVRAPVSLYKAIVDEGSAQRAVRDVATAISMITGLPAAGLARPLGYLAGVADEKIEPTGPIDAARGAVTGFASPDSRQ